MPKQCYLINDEIKFYFDAEYGDLSIQFNGNTQALKPKEAQVLKYMLEHHTAGTISVEAILKANWPRKADKQTLLKLLFELRKKFRKLGVIEDGFIANGPNYQLNYHGERIDELQQELDEMRASKVRWRRYIFIVLAIILALVTMPK